MTIGWMIAGAVKLQRHQEFNHFASGAVAGEPRYSGVLEIDGVATDNRRAAHPPLLFGCRQRREYDSSAVTVAADRRPVPKRTNGHQTSGEPQRPLDQYSDEGSDACSPKT